VKKITSFYQALKRCAQKKIVSFFLPHGVYTLCVEKLYDTIRYDTRCYFNVRSKADISQLNLPHGNFRCNSTKLVHDRFSKFVHSAATNCKRALKIPPHRQRVATTCIIPCEILVFENRPISKLVLKRELVKNRLLKSKTTAKQRLFSDASNISCTDEKMCMVV